MAAVTTKKTTGGFAVIVGPTTPIVRAQWAVKQQKYKSALLTLLADASAKLSKASPVGVFGALAGSWLDSYFVEEKKGAIVGRVGSTLDAIKDQNPTARSHYGRFLIDGTAPAESNPGPAIVPWVERKIGLEGKEAESMAWAIGAKRMAEGSKPNDFVTPVMSRVRRLARKMIA